MLDRSTRLASRMKRPDQPRPYAKKSIRRTHRNLYRSLITVAVVDVLLGLNFLLPFLPAPTFQQLDIPKDFIGAAFLAIGTLSVVFLNFRRNLTWVRIVGWAGVIFAIFWGWGTTETVFEGKSSAQLFILYTGLRAGLVIPLLLEPFFNPMTADEEPEEESK